MVFSRLLSSLSFSNPAKNSVVILHPHDYWIKRLVLKEIPSTTLELYPTRIFITPALIVRTILRLPFVKWFRLGDRAVFKNFLRQIYLQYILACIDQTTAKVVLTIVDNSGIFQMLSRIDPNRTYIAIQNGGRTVFCVRDSLKSMPRSASVISMTNFFCFGQRDVDLFKRYGHKIDTYLPIGSLIGGYYKSQVSGPVSDSRFDLCLISPWHQHQFSDPVGDDLIARWPKRVGTALIGLQLLLLRLLNDTALTLVICPRSRDAAEIAFFKEAFGERAEIAESNPENFSTYRTVEQSRLTISVNSTVLSECFSWGKKVLWCNTPNDEYFEMPEAGLNYFHGENYELFKERVLTLLRMPQKEYVDSTREAAHYINNYDISNPPHEEMQAAIAKLLHVAA
jgi:hypothetical protein